MHIGIDASRATVAARTGTEAYALQLTRALLAAASPHSWELYFREPPPEGLLPARPGPDRPVTHTVIRQRRLWTHWGLARRLHERPPDCLFVPAHVLPIHHPCPSVVTVHDLGYRRFPRSHPFAQRLYLDLATRFSAASATAVLADSQATRDDLIHYYGIPAAKIQVVYPGFDASLKPVRHPDGRWPVRRKYDLPEKFILHVGTLQPRKNLEALIAAYDPAQIGLVLAGRRGWLSDSIYQKGRAKGVVFLDYVADEDLAALYSMATVYAAPSLYEGFGFTVLEAMACGTAVVCSDGGSLPEVAGEAALVVPARDTAALARALARVVEDPDLRRGLIMKGFQNVGRFSWSQAAGQTLRVLDSAAARGRAGR
jgi:glycosyltransferase involved in cell wall biosynthesis